MTSTVASSTDFSQFTSTTFSSPTPTTLSTATSSATNGRSASNAAFWSSILSGYRTSTRPASTSISSSASTASTGSSKPGIKDVWVVGLIAGLLAVLLICWYCIMRRRFKVAFKAALAAEPALTRDVFKARRAAAQLRKNQRQLHTSATRGTSSGDISEESVPLEPLSTDTQEPRVRGIFGHQERRTLGATEVRGGAGRSGQDRGSSERLVQRGVARQSADWEVRDVADPPPPYVPGEDRPREASRESQREEEPSPPLWTPRPPPSGS